MTQIDEQRSRRPIFAGCSDHFAFGGPTAISTPSFQSINVLEYPMPGESFEISMPISSKQGSS
jgi:hypothetical protein